MKSACDRKSNTVGLHFQEVPGIIRFTDKSMASARVGRRNGDFKFPGGSVGGADRNALEMAVVMSAQQMNEMKAREPDEVENAEVGKSHVCFITSTRESQCNRRGSLETRTTEAQPLWV